jgi:aminoglycoside phosphotransferase (APT) family kinase protein
MIVFIKRRSKSENASKENCGHVTYFQGIRMGVAEHDRELEAIRFEIARVAPLFESERVVPLGEGMDSFAVLAGEDFVFRFAKHAQAATGLRREIKLLPRLSSRLNLEIPRFEYAGEHSVTGLAFVGYRFIRGQPLHKPVFDALTGESRGGVIDWGDVSIGDPDYDLAFLAQRLGPSFIEGLLGYFEHPDPARLFEKIASMIIFNAIEDVFIGLERSDRALVDSALADLSSSLP